MRLIGAYIEFVADLKTRLAVKNSQNETMTEIKNVTMKKPFFLFNRS
jgi:hypothetical protein